MTPIHWRCSVVAAFVFWLIGRCYGRMIFVYVGALLLATGLDLLQYWLRKGSERAPSQK